MEWLLIAGAVLFLISQGSTESDASLSSAPDPASSTLTMTQARAVAAGVAGVDARVIEAVERHETDDYTSRLWLEANNPGGMKYSTIPSLGHLWGFVTLDDDSPNEKFAKFPSQHEGITSHGMFLAQSRYEAARQARDPQGQINAIAAAGYATDPLWRLKVWQKYQELDGG